MSFLSSAFLPELRFLSLLDCLSSLSAWACSWGPPLPWPPWGGHRPKMDRRPSTMRERKPACCGRCRAAVAAAAGCSGPAINGTSGQGPKQSTLGGTNIGTLPSPPSVAFPTAAGSDKSLSLPAPRSSSSSPLQPAAHSRSRPFDFANSTFLIISSCLLMSHDLTRGFHIHPPRHARLGARFLRREAHIGPEWRLIKAWRM